MGCASPVAFQHRRHRRARDLGDPDARHAARPSRRRLRSDHHNASPRLRPPRRRASATDSTGRSSSPSTSATTPTPPCSSDSAPPLPQTRESAPSHRPSSTPPATRGSSRRSRPPNPKTRRPATSSTDSATTCSRPPPRAPEPKRSSADPPPDSSISPTRSPHGCPVHRGGRRAVVPVVDDRVPLDPRPAQGSDHEPVVDRRRLRRDRRRVPMGMGRDRSSGSTKPSRSHRSCR